MTEAHDEEARRVDVRIAEAIEETTKLVRETADSNRSLASRLDRLAEQMAALAEAPFANLERDNDGE